MRRWMTGALVGLVACGAPSADAPDASSEDAVVEAPEGPLASSFSVQVSDDSVRFELAVTNTASEPLVLEFPTAQRFDFAVQAAGEDVWRWSSDMMFAQVLSTDTLAVGETVSYGAAWQPADRTGEYEAVATLLATSHPVDLRTAFALTEE